jgi:hypothetical protein
MERLKNKDEYYYRLLEEMYPERANVLNKNFKRKPNVYSLKK